MSKKKRKKKPVAPPKKPTGSPTPPAAHTHPQRWTWDIIGLGLLILFVLFVRVRLLGMPLERDEGGFAYIAYQMIEGKSLYADLYEIKPPLLYLTYALFITIFGHSIEGIHIGLLFFDISYILLLFFFAKAFFDRTVALVAAAAFAILSLSPSLLGFAAHATHFAILPGLGGLWLLLHALDKGDKRRFWGAGLLLGIAFLYKQQVVHLMFFAGVFTIYDFARQKPFDVKNWLLSETALILGSTTPYLVVILGMTLSGRLDDFWFYTVTWPAGFATSSETGASWFIFELQIGNVLNNQSWLWITAALGLVALFLVPTPPRKRVWLVLFTGFMCAAVATGFHFYQHYFVVLIPAVALLNGIFVQNGGHIIQQWLNVSWGTLACSIVFIMAWSQIIYLDSDYFTDPDYTTISRRAYGTNPFVESPYIGEFIQNNSQPDEAILIACSEPQIGFYAQRNSVSGQAFTYPLVDNGPHMKRLQDEFIQDVQEGRPTIIVYTWLGASWLARDTSRRIFNFIEKTTQEEYALIGAVENRPQRASATAPIQYPVTYQWGADASAYMQQRMSQWQQDNARRQQQGQAPLPAPNVITIWRRNTAPTR